MRRLTSYRRIAAELPALGTLATTRSGEMGEVIAHEDGEAVLQFAGYMRGSYAPDEITWQVVGAQTEGKWQTEGAELHLAGDDYKELTDILTKPAPAIVQEGNEWGRVASKPALNGPIGEDTNHDGIENCPKCGGVRTFTSGGQAVPGSKGQNMCYHCFHTWDKTTSKTASLNDKMDFDHVVQVLPGGQVVDAHGVYAPELYDDELQGAGWTLMDGYSGQSGYSGPIMHNSEYIGGGLERDILANPGYYVTLVNNSYDEEEGEGWAIAYKAASKTATVHVAWEIEDVRSSVEQGWYGQSGVDGTKIDQFSASALTQVYDALSPENQATLRAMPIERAVDVAFKLIKKHQGSKSPGSCNQCDAPFNEGTYAGTGILHGTVVDYHNCPACGFQGTVPSKGTTSSKTADGPGYTETIYDPFNAFTPQEGECPTCFGEGAFSELLPDGKGFGPEHDCPDCGGSGRES